MTSVARPRRQTGRDLAGPCSLAPHRRTRLDLLTASLFQAETSTVPGLVENWTLTCARDGRVLERVPVVVDRGQRLRVDRKACGCS